MPHEHAAFLHPNQLPGCRSIALRLKFRALEGSTGGRWKWRLTSPASFHPSSFQSVSQAIDGSLLPPSLSSRTSELCEGPQTTLLSATSSTPPPPFLALELDTPRCRSPVKETALAIGDAATEPPPPRRRTVLWPRSQGHRVRTSRTAEDSLLQISHRRLVAHGSGSCSRAAGFQPPQTSSPAARFTLQPSHDAYQFAVLTTSARNARDHFRKAGGHSLEYLIRAAMARLSSTSCFQKLQTLPARTGSSTPSM